MAVLRCAVAAAPHALDNSRPVQWQTVGDVQIDTGANASAEEAEETLDDSARKVVDIIESFRLVVRRPVVPAAAFRQWSEEQHGLWTSL